MKTTWFNIRDSKSEKQNTKFVTEYVAVGKVRPHIESGKLLLTWAYKVQPLCAGREGWDVITEFQRTLNELEE